MFTGIVESVGSLTKVDGNIYTFSHPFRTSFAVGESVALSGMCATVLTSDETSFTVEIIAESRKRTIFGTISVGDVINLERSVVIGQRNSGHNVQGHIDEVGNIKRITKEGDYWLVRVGISVENRLFVVQKGSIALDGVSLTISGVSDIDHPEAWVEVSLISHTWQETTLHTKKEGDGIHIEYDVMGRYIVQAATVSK